MSHTEEAEMGEASHPVFFRIASLLICAATFALGCLVCTGVTYYYTCQRESPAPRSVRIGYPLLAEVEYIEASPPRGDFHQGTRKFTFSNISTDKTLTVCLPALAVYHEVQPNNFHAEDQTQWPDFSREHTVFTLPPNGTQVFEDPYELVGSVGSAWGFVFGPCTGEQEKEGEVYVGCVVTADWTDSVGEEGRAE